MPGVEQTGGVRPRHGAVRGHHHALAGGQPVVLDHPGRLAGIRTEAAQGGVEVGGAVHDLAASGAHAGGGHHVLGERLGPFDPGGIGGRPETGDPGGANRVGHTEHQRHLRPDDHQVGLHVTGQGGNRLTGGDVDISLLGHRRGPGVAGSDHQLVVLRVVAKGQQQGVLAGAGPDNQDAHGCLA